MKFPNPVFANLIWAALFLEIRLLAVPVVLTGLIIEYFFVWRLTNFSVKRSILADITMNAASLLLGIVLIPLAGFGWEFTIGRILYEQFQMGSFSFIGWAASFILAVLINASIEYLILRTIFKLEKDKSGFSWLCLANALTVGIALASLWFFPMKNI
jgi:hypothetical protein